MKTITLTQEQVALVDDEDYEWLNQWKWHALKCRNTYYAVREKNRKSVLMHRQILNAQPREEIDHNNHNGLDNRKSKIRICTHIQNMQNQKSRIHTSKFKGICWNKKRQNWQVQIRVNGKRIWLGYFRKEIEAALAYDLAAKYYFGDFARLNF